MSRLRRRTASTAAALMSVLALTAGCSDAGGEPKTTESPSPTQTQSSPTETPSSSAPATPKARAIAEAKDLITDYFAYRDRWSANPKPANTRDLDDYLVDPELTSQKQLIEQFREQGFYTNGGRATFEWMKVTHVALTPAQKQATISIRLCYNIDDVVTYNKPGDIVSKDQISPGIATFEVWNRTYPSTDGWRIGVENIPGKECK